MLSILFLGITTGAFAQKKAIKNVEIKAVKVEKSRGENPNIVKGFSCNGPDVEVAKPAKSRSSYCAINVDNYTGFYVNVYVDGAFYGMVSPWSDGDVTVYGGYTRVYCQTAGGTYEWLATGNCDDNFHYKISADNAR